MSRACSWLVLWVLAASLVGCGGQKLPPGARPTKKVTVTVNYKGAPVEGAAVTFVNKDGDPAPANGRTDKSGKAIMKTYVEGDGAVLGLHQVLISKMEAVGGQTVDVDNPKYDPNAPPAVTKYLIPAKYSALGNGLTAEVKDGPNEFTFDLKD